MAKKLTIGVIGGATGADENLQTAYEVGCHIARNGAVLVCSGLGGVMEAVCHGAADNGATVVGILPGTNGQGANPFVTIALPTALGSGSDGLVVQSADVLIAFGGSYATLSAMGYALSLDKGIVQMPGAWQVQRAGVVESRLCKQAHDAAQALGLALGMLSAP
jgi:uncharacterized protein (TIGR00725 family)